VTGGCWVPVADFVAASGWCRVVARAGVTVDAEIQASAEAETLRQSGVEVRECVRHYDSGVTASGEDIVTMVLWVPMAGLVVEPGAVQAEIESLRRSGVEVRECVRNDDPGVAAWARELDEAVARAKGQVRNAALEAHEAERARRTA
jgi:hypothetical protein